jgi:hypothetical protein
VGTVIGDVLPLAVGVAVSPVPVIAVVLMLFAPRAGSTSTGFLLGWVAGIIIAVVAFTLLAGLVGGDGEDGPSTTILWIKVVLGVGFVLLAWAQWRGRPRAGSEPEPPGWMKAVDTFTAGRATGLGFLLSALNPKNLAMAIAAGVAIGGSGISGGQQAVVIVVFTVLAASTVAIPVVAFAVAADRMRDPLHELKTWLEANNATVMTVLLGVIGVVVFGQGLGGLL